MEPLKLETLEQIAIEKGCDIALPLKEKQAIEVVRQFFGRVAERSECRKGELLFGGGTSLVCAYDELILRFSEDIDLRFCPKPKSTRLLRQVFTEIASSLDGFTLVDEPKADSRKVEYHLQSVDGTLWTHSALRAHIKLEIFFADRPAYPARLRPLTSIYRRTCGQPPEVLVPCVALEQTAIDKLCALFWRIYSDGIDSSRYDPADMRHLNDLAYLAEYLTLDDAFAQAFREAFTADIAARLKTPLAPEALIHTALQRLVDTPRYANDFTRYVENVSYAKRPPDFSHCLTTLNALLKQIGIQ